jgi:flagellar biosynthesis chaperone FliJ
MKSLETLLKVAQRRLDDVGREMARLNQHLDGLRVEEAKLIGREQAEIAAAMHDIALMVLIPDYRRRVAHQVALVRARTDQAEALMADMRARLTAAYQEKSKFEELLKRERIREAQTRSALEQSALDEAAINRVGR